MSQDRGRRGRETAVDNKGVGWEKQLPAEHRWVETGSLIEDKWSKNSSLYKGQVVRVSAGYSKRGQGDPSSGGRPWGSAKESEKVSH